MQPPCKHVAQTKPVTRFIKPTEMQRLLGVSRSTLYRGIRSGCFPTPIKLSENKIGWREDDFNAWLYNR
ncbi:AlpA family phage regulatory protein [Photobacterium ganghwense]|uniref:helix-turn-helix transcriptional regulator n=1 Tax=Photobacterium ganghwense TaxID=320778 RepID=UPI000A01DBC1|nr:AlpA family phage regulatory protein [Photobacterium ganghwense]